MIRSVSREQLQRVRRHLIHLYGGRSEQLIERFCMMIGRYGLEEVTIPSSSIWDEHDTILISYADSLIDESIGKPLSALHSFANQHLKGAIRTVHLLPFCPWSSDDGFSVIDYRKVDDDSGDWEDIEQLRGDFNLMFDLVLNHCSSESSWFSDYIAGIEPARHYFIEANPKLDYSLVVRPRTSPLLTKTRTRSGESHVWTTFSSDQIDLNWKNPEVLFEFIDILMLYISKGMRIVRLDAVAFLWKNISGKSIHEPETHEIVCLLRDILEIIAPQTILLTETNVPHSENVSYFGQGDEAQMVYQFSLPPLLMHGLATGNATFLTKWAYELKPPPEGCTFFNFTASHDGIGLRPIEGLLPDSEAASLIKHVESSGGRISWRTMPDGTELPYELNITYYSALTILDNPQLGAQRFLCSQAIMLSLRGIPGIYIHSLTASSNDLQAAEESGINRRINRHKWNLPELDEHLKDPTTKLVFDSYIQMLRRRSNHPAFHPDATQEVFNLNPRLFVHSRTSVSNDEIILCIYNFSNSTEKIDAAFVSEQLGNAPSYYEVLSARLITSQSFNTSLKPYQSLWLVARF